MKARISLKMNEDKGYTEKKPIAAIKNKKWCLG
jgi:hypothetical protein